MLQSTPKQGKNHQRTENVSDVCKNQDWKKSRNVKICKASNIPLTVQLVAEQSIAVRERKSFSHWREREGEVNGNVVLKRENALCKSERGTSSMYERHVLGVRWVWKWDPPEHTCHVSVTPTIVVYLSYDPAPESVSAASIYSSSLLSSPHCLSLFLLCPNFQIPKPHISISLALAASLSLCFVLQDSSFSSSIDSNQYLFHTQDLNSRFLSLFIWLRIEIFGPKSQLI